MNESKTACTCVVCGADITRTIKLYPYGLEGGPYCYDCCEKIKLQRRLKKERNAYQDTVDQILTMYRRKKKVSEIARVMDMSAKEVLEIISEELDR